MAGLHGGDATGAGQADRAGNRKQIIPTGAARPDRGADQPRAVTGQPQVKDEAERRISAGRWQAQYLVKLVQIGLQERETGQNAEADRKELQAIRYYMRESERQHVKEYGGRPRPILTKEERDYIKQNQDAPAYGGTREQIKKELAQAFVIGETRGTALERQPERSRGGRRSAHLNADGESEQGQGSKER